MFLCVRAEHRHRQLNIQNNAFAAHTLSVVDLTNRTTLAQAFEDRVEIGAAKCG